jgi:hypothetical protein
LGSMDRKRSRQGRPNNPYIIGKVRTFVNQNWKKCLGRSDPPTFGASLASTYKMKPAFFCRVDSRFTHSIRHAPSRLGWNPNLDCRATVQLSTSFRTQNRIEHNGTARLPPSFAVLAPQERRPPSVRQR